MGVGGQAREDSRTSVRIIKTDSIRNGGSLDKSDGGRYGNGLIGEILQDSLDRKHWKKRKLLQVRFWTHCT